MICTTVAWGSKCSAAMQASPVGCSRRCCKSVLNLASESLFFGVRSSVRNHPARALRLHHSVDSCSPAVYHFSNKYKPGAVWQAHRRMGTTGHGRRKKKEEKKNGVPWCVSCCWRVARNVFFFAPPPVVEPHFFFTFFSVLGGAKHDRAGEGAVREAADPTSTRGLEPTGGTRIRGSTRFKQDDLTCPPDHGV